MASTTIQHINHLARLLQTHLGRRMQSEKLREQIGIVQKLGGVTTGEEALLERLEILLEKTISLFQKLEDVKNLQETKAIADEIETVLEDIVWEEAEFFEEWLGKQAALLESEQAKAESERQRIEEELAEWDSQLAEVEKGLTDALRIGAAVIQQQQEIVRLRSIVEAARSALNERKEHNLKTSRQHWENSPCKPGELQVLIAAAQRDALRLSLQSDLILLQSPAVQERYYDYTVLLRTLSQRGQRGVNIQDTRKVSVPDRQTFNATVQEATARINSGWRSAIETAGNQANIRHFVEAQTINKELEKKDIGLLIQEAGELMYRIVVPESMQSYLIETQGSITITTNDLELPWELMAYPKQVEDPDGLGTKIQQTFLCLDRPVGRIPMGYALPRREPLPRFGQRKKRFAFFYADPHKDLPGARQEVEQIMAGLEASQKENVEVIPYFDKNASGQQLNNILLREQFDVIHFAGHAGFDTNDPDMSSLVLHDNELYFSEKIRTLLSGQPLIFLNACQTGRSANEEAKATIDYLQRPAAGLASAFIYGGALGCIGSLWPIYDNAAAQFAIDFYNKLLEGHMIGEALRQARINSRKAFENHVTWASYVLYGNPTLRLVES